MRQPKTTLELVGNWQLLMMSRVSRHVSMFARNRATMVGVASLHLLPIYSRILCIYYAKMWHHAFLHANWIWILIKDCCYLVK